MSIGLTRGRIPAGGADGGVVDRSTCVRVRGRAGGGTGAALSSSTSDSSDPVTGGKTACSVTKQWRGAGEGERVPFGRVDYIGYQSFTWGRVAVAQYPLCISPHLFHAWSILIWFQWIRPPQRLHLPPRNRGPWGGSDPRHRRAEAPSQKLLD